MIPSGTIIRFHLVVALLCCAVGLHAQPGVSVAPRSFGAASGISFTENRGQLIDAKGQLRPDILYKGDAGNVMLFFSRDHISYVYSQLSDRAYAYIKHDCTPDPDNPQPGDLPGGKPHPDSVLQRYYRMDLDFVGGNPNAKVTSRDVTASYTNFYYGHCPNGITRVPSFHELTYHDVYPHIDMVISSNKNGVKYDFIVHPGGHVEDIAMRYDAGTPELTYEGALRVANPLGYIEEQAPYVYQMTKAGTAGPSVRSMYRLENGIIRFTVGGYDQKRDLVIDPTQQWATFYGGTGTENMNGGDPTEVDRQGNSFITGYSVSNPFPTSPGASQTTFGGGASFGDAFLVKFDPYGNVVFSTYYGGSGDEIAHGVSSDADGNSFITGHTENGSPNTLPTTVGAYQRTYGLNRDAFVAKFNPAGAMLWATFIGGNDFDDGYAFAVDSSKNVAVALTTETQTAPSTWPAGTVFINGHPGTGANNKDILVMKFTPAGAQVWGYFIGGTGAGTEYAYGAASDINDNILVTGWTNGAGGTGIATVNAAQPASGGGYDALVAKLSPTGSVLWCTYCGGPGTENSGFGTTGYSGMATDLDGDVYITGCTTGANFPTTAGAFQSNWPAGKPAARTCAFIVKYNSNGVRQWATYFGGGGSNTDVIGIGAASNTQGSVLITGFTNDPGLQVAGAGQQAAFQAVLLGTDAYIAKFDKNGVAKWITYFGGTGTDNGEGISYDPYGSIFIAGHTTSPSAAPFMLQSPHQLANGQALARPGNSGNTDAFISSFCDPDPVRVDSSGPKTFCNPDSVTFSILYGYLNVRWYKLGEGGNPTVVVGTADTLVVKETGKFFVRVENAGGCLSGSDTLQTTRLDRINPQIQPGPAYNLCTGDTVTLSVTPGPMALYTWKKAGVTVGSSPTYKAFAGGSYQVLVTDPKGCTDSTTMVITEYAKPTPISVSPSDTVVMCEGESRTLTATGGVGGTITWSTGFVGAAASVSQPGTYFARSVGPNNCERISNKVVVKVNKKPIPKILALLPIAFCDGDSTVLAATLTPGGPTTPYKTYLWSPGGETTDRVSRKVSGDVTVTVTDTNGCQASATVTVTVNEVPHPKLVVTPDTVICEGDSVTIGTDQGYGGYRWNTGSTDPRIRVGKSGYYSVTVSTLAGCEGKSDSVHVSVKPAPVAKISGPVAVCINTPGSYSVPATPGVTYSWGLKGPSGTIASGDGSPSIVVNWAGNGSNTVYVTVTNPVTKCSAVDTVHVDVGSVLVPNITFAGTTQLCPGDSIVLDAGPGYTKYTWQPGGETGRTITVKTAGTYTVAVENAGGCNGTSKPLDITISTPPKPVITVFSGKTALCPGDTVWLDAGPGYTDYLWSNGYSNQKIPVWRADSFLVSVTDTNGCTGVSEKMYVTMNTPPAPIVQGPNSVCINSDDDYLIAGDPLDQYTWKVAVGNGTIVSGAGTPSIKVHWATAGTDTLELTQISTSTGCVGSTKYVVNVGTTLTPSITPGRTTPFCEGDSVSLTAASGYKTYLWDNGALTQTIYVKQSGTYSVTVTDAGGCSGTGSISVSQKTKVTPAIVPDGKPGLCSGDSLQLEATPGFRHYLWAPNGDTTRIIWVNKAGTYTVTVTDLDSCSGTSAGVDVTLYPVIAQPKIITQGDTMVAIIDVVDSPSPSGYQWNLNGSPVSSATSQRYFASVVGGSYTVTVVDSNGCKATSEPFTPTTSTSAEVEVPTITGVPGQHITIPLMLKSSQNLDRGNVRNFTANLRFDASLLVPVDKSLPSVITGHDRVLTVTGARAASVASGELIKLEFIAALGDRTSTPLTLETFRWTDTTNGVVPTTRLDGVFTLTGICENGGQRLVDASGAVHLKPAHPNPTNSRTEIEYEVVEPGRTQLYVVDMLGKRDLLLVDGEITPGSYMVEFDASQLQSGLYFYILQTPTQRLSRMMQVVK